jgi:hypothetical protein
LIVVILSKNRFVRVFERDNATQDVLSRWLPCQVPIGDFDFITTRLLYGRFLTSRRIPTSKSTSILDLSNPSLVKSRSRSFSAPSRGLPRQSSRVSRSGRFGIFVTIADHGTSTDRSKRIPASLSAGRDVDVASVKECWPSNKENKRRRSMFQLLSQSTDQISSSYRSEGDRGVIEFD